MGEEDDSAHFVGVHMHTILSIMTMKKTRKMQDYCMHNFFCFLENYNTALIMMMKLLTNLTKIIFRRVFAFS